MTPRELTSHRLLNLQVSKTTFTKPEQLLSFFCGMQAQDYSQAKWAIGLRLPNSTDNDIEKAIIQKKIVRTWAMRGTMQFVAVKDYRWILSFYGEKNIRGASSRNRQLGLDERTLDRAIAVISRTMKDEGILTRNEVGSILTRSGITLGNNRLSHILHHSVSRQTLCFGPRKEKQFTFVLLDDWIPAQKSSSREKALQEISQRYFFSRGPATLEDFMWWSGLRGSDARSGFEMVKHSLQLVSFKKKEYWMSKKMPVIKKDQQSVYLLAGFDEYLISYANRSVCLNPKFNQKAIFSNGIFHPIIVVDGQVVGTWRPAFKKNRVTINQNHFTHLTKSQLRGIESECERSAEFMGMELEI